VEVESAGLGKGSTFRIRLPLAPEQSLAENGAAPVAIPSLSILVVDDNQDAAELLALNLELDGHQVRTVVRPEEAVGAALDWQPQFVLLDIGMPGMDGYEVARRLRAEPRLNALRIIALTGYGQPDDTLRSREAGFDGHLVKPAPLETVTAMLETLRPR
jgi:two-component system CheB/CheR fusion protein